MYSDGIRFSFPKKCVTLRPIFIDHPLMRIIITISIILGIISYAGAQTDSKVTGLLSDIRITGKGGISQLITEFSSTGPINEFNNKPGMTYGIELSKQFSRKWEAGAELLVSILRGETDSPDFSAIGNHPLMMTPINEPVIYRNELTSQKIYLQYNLNSSDRNGRYLPFVRAGAGLLPYKSELRYRDNKDNGLIFGKNVEEYSKNKMSTALYFAGTGIRAAVNSNIELNAAVTVNLVNYDFLDVVHNYDTAGERLKIRGIYSDLTIGLTFLLNNSGKYVKKRPRKGGKRNPANLPFSGAR